jgi:hypothetical protein
MRMRWEVMGSKQEIRNKHEGPKSKIQSGSCSQRQRFGPSNFGFVSDFGFRASDFLAQRARIACACMDSRVKSESRSETAPAGVEGKCAFAWAGRTIKKGKYMIAK